MIALGLVLAACRGGEENSEDDGSSSSTSPTGTESTFTATASTDSSGAVDSESGAGSTGATETTSGDGTGESTTGSPACGDGTLDEGEECDEGDVIDDDGCDSDCVRTIVQLAGDGPEHACLLTRNGSVRCWGAGGFGQLGYADTMNVGDDETPASVGDVDVGGVVVQIAAGHHHTCAVLEGGAVRCWGRGLFGRLGYGNEADVGDDETPASAGDVDVGGVAVQVVTGYDHTCALLEGGAVRCWGSSYAGQLGYADPQDIGDDEVPAGVGPVDVGGTGTVVEIAAGAAHTCARMDTGAVRCWGEGVVGATGLQSSENIGDDEPPADAADVMVAAEPVVVIAAAYSSTCVLLENGAIRCWGFNGNGECGYGNTENVGDDEHPASVGDIAIGGPVVQVNAGPCALLDDGTMRCWGLGATGALGLGNVENVGDDELPDGVGPIDLGGAVVLQHSDGIHACALLQSGAVRCWGLNNVGQLGYGHTENIGDDELPTEDVPVF